MTVITYGGLAAVCDIYGSDEIAHKYYQPLLIGVMLTFVVIYCYCSCAAGERLCANLTLFLGIPCYFGLFYTGAFVTLVPGYDWVTFFDNFLLNIQVVVDWFSKLTSCIFDLAIIIFVYMYRERLFRFVGVDTVNLFRFSLWDIADPTYRERSFVGIKVAIKHVQGRLPANDLTTRSNDLFIQVRCSDNEPVNTRVHNHTRTDERAVPFEEVLQINIPKDRSSTDKVYIVLQDQEILGSEEIARKVFTIRDIYDIWFDQDANPDSYAGDKQLVADPRRGLEVVKNGAPVYNAVFREYKLNFLSESAEAKIVLGMLPADRKAVEHFHSQRGVLGKISTTIFGDDEDRGNYRVLRENTPGAPPHGP
jgi:hypothetical protein